MDLLKNVRIIDLCDEKGSFCSKLLADLGASVIKLENPGGDPSRMAGDFPDNSSYYAKNFSFFYNNTNKLGITLNLKSAKGRELFLKLVKYSDVVVESFMSGFLGGLGIEYEKLREINPGVIMASVTGFGQNGPMKDCKSSDLVASAVSGQMYVSGAPANTPLRPFGEQSYFTGSLYAAIGILMALRSVRKTGEGTHIDISLQETALSTLDHVMIRYFHDHVIAGRQGNLHWNNFFRIVRCKDGFIHITPFQQWETLVEWMNSEGMAGDLIGEKWKDEAYRIKNSDHVIEVLQGWTMTHTSRELFELGQLMQFPWAPVCNLQAVLASPQLKSRNFFHESHGPGTAGHFKYPGTPFKSSVQSSAAVKGAPLPGEDNIRIYRDELGLSEEEIAELSSEGVI